jgi:hypothetical protein
MICARTVRLAAIPLSKAPIMKMRAAIVVALVTSIAGVTSADAQTGAGISTDDVRQPSAVVEASGAPFDAPTVSSSAIAAAQAQGPTISAAGGVGLGAAFGQAIGFTVVQHLFRLQEGKTRRELGGPFLSDWFKSVSHLGGDFSDHGKMFANYVAHPMGGAVYAHIYRQNDRSRRELEVGEPGYGGMVLRALAFSTVISLQFELGPLSEASIGNVGMRDPRKMAWGDLVITPVFGTAWMVAEDLIDEKILKRMDGQQIVWRNTVRFFLNPSRTAANMSRLKWPWYRTRDLEPGRRPGAP